MTDNNVRRLRAIRDELRSILGSGRALSQADLARELVRRRLLSISEPVMYALVGVAVRLYDCEFYRDRSTGRISLTRGALARIGNSGTGVPPVNDRQDACPTKIIGTTAVGRIHDALEAAEA